jgi:hypothetical protein
MASTITAMPSTRMSEAEWQTRLDLAACYRLVDLFGWSDLVNTRITARVPGHDHFLINPYGHATPNAVAAAGSWDKPLNSKEPVTVDQTSPALITWKFLPPTHGSLEWKGGVATWSSQHGWSGDSRPEAEWLEPWRA